MTKDDSYLHTNRSRPDPTGNQVSVCHNWQEDESPALGVVNAIAAATDTAPERLQPLYESVDPDALNMLFESVSGLDRHPSQLSVSFRHEGCDVVVQSNGKLYIWLEVGEHDE
ncbi:HalOD1 output domain-containing protein [Halostagnicola larsenii]|uniref:HalOD1 output domain-containing protein n=1 Tax=Halostagnicola larsenii TaxID=353800 RepID=UPI0012FB4E74|nr:HalOD1 output domain-containing protein [Halostagnicola larsenii]